MTEKSRTTSSGERRPSGEVTREITGNVAVLTMRRDGRGNAWGVDMATSLVAHLADLEVDDGVRACVLVGDGKNFCSGADIGNEESHKVRSAGGYLKNLSPYHHYGFDALDEFRKPMVAAVRGNAIGAGFLLAITCDVVLASESAKFVLPHGRLGIVPGSGGLLRLAQWVGRGRALEIAMSGRAVQASEALSIGIASATYSDDQVLEEAVSYASRLAASPPLALWAIKESMQTGMDVGSLRNVALLDKYRSGLLQMTQDTAEAHASWRERREAVYEID